MKKNAVIALLLVIVLACGGYFYIKKHAKTPEKLNSLSQSVDIKLPSGEIVKAFRIAKKESANIEDKKGENNEFILKGTVLRESEGVLDTTIIETDFGQKFVLFNAPYVNTLSKEVLGKTVTLKCKPFGTTSFKSYKGAWIEDIVSVEQPAAK
jgi:hypothetical protein